MGCDLSYRDWATNRSKNDLKDDEAQKPKLVCAEILSIITDVRF